MLQSNFTQQSVLILGEGTLLDEAVTQLLTQKTNLSVYHTIYSDDLVVVNVVERNQPDVILVCESGSLDTAHILDMVASHSVATKVRIFVVRPGNNMMDVYASPIAVAGKISCKPRQIIVKTADDLLNAVRRKEKTND